MPLTIRRRLVDHVRQWRKTAYAICVALVVAAGAVVFLSVSTPASTVELSSDATFLEANHTFRLAEEMTRLYPERPLGSEDAGGATTWLAEKLVTLGIPTEMVNTTAFTVPLGNRDMTLRNVSVTLEGGSKETIVITAPRDTPPIAKIDPLSYASGTAILMDLAQIFASRPHDKTIVFLWTEGTNSGGPGIQHFLETHPRADEISAILSIQGLGKERTKVMKIGVTGAQNTTPGWYVQLVIRALDKRGLGVSTPGFLSQAADHALALARGEQVAGLNRGIPALLLCDEGNGNPTPSGISIQGAAIESLLLSLDGGGQLPLDPGTGLLLQSGRFLTNRAIQFLAALMLLPSIAALLIWLFTSPTSMRVTLRHLRNLVSFALPAGVLLLAAFVLSRLRLIPRYHFQVPTMGAAIEPRLLPVLILIVVTGVAFILSRHFLGYLKPREPRATTEMAKLWTGLLALAVGLLLMLVRSPFLLLPCLAAAWAWPLATCFAEPVYSGALWRHRFTSNAPVLLVGVLTPLLLYAYMAATDGVGWTRAWWFLLVQMVSGSYGALGPLGFILLVTSFLVLLSVRRMRVIPIETLDVTDELSLLELPVPRARRKQAKPSQPPLSPWR
jgi:hypothetical protein